MEKPVKILVTIELEINSYTLPLNEAIEEFIESLEEQEED